MAALTPGDRRLRQASQPPRKAGRDIRPCRREPVSGSLGWHRCCHRRCGGGGRRACHPHGCPAKARAYGGQQRQRRGQAARERQRGQQRQHPRGGRGAVRGACRLPGAAAEAAGQRRGGQPAAPALWWPGGRGDWRAHRTGCGSRVCSARCRHAGRALRMPGATLHAGWQRGCPTVPSPALRSVAFAPSWLLQNLPACHASPCKQARSAACIPAACGACRWQ